MKKESLSKLKNLHYNKFEMQEYLQDNKTSIEEKQMLFRWRTFMASFGCNFRAGRKEVLCPLCLTHQDEEDLSFQCPVIKTLVDLQCSFNSVFKSIIEYTTVETLRKIDDTRNSW